MACKVLLSGSDTMPLTVRVWTNLDSGANDESFGIDNVIIQKIGSETPAQKIGSGTSSTNLPERIDSM